MAALYAEVIAANLTGVLVDISNAELLLMSPPSVQAAGPAAAPQPVASGAASPTVRRSHKAIPSAHGLLILALRNALVGVPCGGPPPGLPRAPIAIL